ncbi:hypothetical protein EDD29_5773 [Actinocorallia herbida]|uniref:Uncharacterized protein n=1 Tax=Actinocorallia herbida TaxID=58109 RepID=A0A3N1D3L4_9ACTN|nr:hypothetical protein [Actinocorallia herbida]ROO88115.1 hypothetical protein EDD29_5773 [Actinocorallia herbida]
MVGAHGGSGCSTLAALLQPSWDLGSIGHLYEVGEAPVRSDGRPLVVACRNTVPAAKAATTAVTVLGSHREWVACLVVVGDGAAEPKDASARFTLLQARVGGIVRFPYLREVRLVDDPALVELSGSARRALRDIRGYAAEAVVPRREGSGGMR